MRSSESVSRLPEVHVRIDALLEIVRWTEIFPSKANVHRQTVAEAEVILRKNATRWHDSPDRNLVWFLWSGRLTQKHSMHRRRRDTRIPAGLLRR